MEIAEAENRLIERLSMARGSPELHRKALDSESPSSLRDLAAVGLDTNILKALRRDPTFADQLFLTLKSNDVALIAPSQVLVEYWNNHKIFASEDWSGFATDLGKLTKRLESGNLLGSKAKTIEQIRALVDEIADDLQEAKSPEYISKSKNLVNSLLETASTPHASRSRLAELAEVRMYSKMPPGFADEKSKGAPWGDFFVWCDFLLGALCLNTPPERTKFVWVTDETKPDWKTGPNGHPSLLEEFEWVCGAELSILSFEDLKLLRKADDAKERADKAGGEFDDGLDGTLESAQD